MAQKYLYVDANGDYTEANGYETSDFINVSAGAGDAGKPIVLDAGGKIDESMIEDGDIDHGSIGGLADDDHTQYHNDTRGDARYYTQTQLGSTSNAEGASLIGVEDASAYYTGTDIEAVLNELEGQIGGLTSSTYSFTEDNVLADNDPIYSALNKLDLKWGDLASNANGEGASLVGLEDAGAYFTTDNVEAALQQLAADVEAGKDYVTYTVGTGGVTKGDLCYISANDTVLPYATLTQAHRGIGLAASTESAAASVNVLANDEVLTGVLTSATAGDPYYWDGSGLVTTIPSGSGSHVWQAGVAKNATDLHVEVRFIKVNI